MSCTCISVFTKLGNSSMLPRSYSRNKSNRDHNFVRSPNSVETKASHSTFYQVSNWLSLTNLFKHILKFRILINQTVSVRSQQPQNLLCTFLFQFRRLWRPCYCCCISTFSLTIISIIFGNRPRNRTCLTQCFTLWIPQIAVRTSFIWGVVYIGRSNHNVDVANLNSCTNLNISSILSQLQACKQHPIHMNDFSRGQKLLVVA